MARLLSVRLSPGGRVLAAVLLAAAAAMFVLLVGAGPAGAQVPSDPGEAVTVADVVDWAQVIGVIVGFATPYVVAALTKLSAQLWVKSLVAGLTIALPAVVTYLTDVSGARSWEGALSVFVLALFSAGASRTVITGGSDTRLARSIEKSRRLKGKADFGFGRSEPLTHPHVDVA